MAFVLRRDSTLQDVAEDIRGHMEEAPCYCEPCETCKNFVPGEGPSDAEVVFVGEAPGEHEDIHGVPFCGPSGDLLDELLVVIGLDRQAVFITNILKARPPRNRDPRPEEINHHAPWLWAQLAIIKPKLIVPLGRHALMRLVPDARISDVHGIYLRHAGRRFYPIYHPSYGLRDPQAKRVMFRDAERLSRRMS